jgi:integrase
MSLYRRKKTWWIRFTTPTGKRIRRSTGTADKRQAQELEAKLKAAYWRTQRLKEKPRVRWDAAAARWLKEKSHKATIEGDRSHLRWLEPYLAGRYLDEITRDLIDQITDIRLQDGVANATVNRLLATLRGVLRKAEREWGWLERAPAIRMMPQPRLRIRSLTRKEADRLIAALPEHLEEMVRFSLATGLRKGNVTGLEWSQVDLKRRCAWIHPDQAKARRAIGVPLNSDAMLVLRRQLGKHPRYAFTYRGRRITQVNTKAWKAALKRAGIGDFRWHDLRHTWASWHAQAGTPQNVLQELGGWETGEMVRRYAHFNVEHLADYAEKLSRPRVVRGTNLAHAVDNSEVRES